MTAEVYIHELAVVDSDVVLGAGTRVWQFASVTRGVVMGADCSVSPHAMLDGSVYGDRVRVGHGVAIGPGAMVGSDVHLGPGVCLANDLWPFASKDGYDEKNLRAGHKFTVRIAAGAAIGANAIILPGVRVGAGALVAAGAVVDRSVPDGFAFYRNGYVREIPSDWAERRHEWASS